MDTLDGQLRGPDASAARAEPRTIDPSAPFFIVMNPGSGHEEAAEVRAILEDALRRAGRDYELSLVGETRPLPQLARDTVERARERSGVVVAVGGDGTINAVASAVYGSGCPLGIVPRGTFNYFSREHGIPADPGEAVALLLSARAHPVQIGLVCERPFLVNASLGLHPQMFEDREGFQRALGRRRWVALLSSFVTLFRHRHELTLDVEYEGRTRMVRTRTLFVGNNAIQLERIGISDAPAIEQGRLVALVVRSASLIELLWLVLRGAFGRLGDADRVASFGLRRIVVRPRRSRSRMKVAVDGELVRIRPPIEFAVGAEPLHLIKPDDAGPIR